jgi:hypothetical protein
LAIHGKQARKLKDGAIPPLSARLFQFVLLSPHCGSQSRSTRATVAWQREIISDCMMDFLQSLRAVHDAQLT